MSAETPDPHAGGACQACGSAPGSEVTPAGLLCGECARKLGQDTRRDRV